MRKSKYTASQMLDAMVAKQTFKDIVDEVAEGAKNMYLNGKKTLKMQKKRL